MKKYLIILFFALAAGHPSVSYAQVQAKFEVAKDMYERLAFSDAIPMLEDYLAKKDNLEAKIILADAYRQNNQYANAEAWYAKVVEDKNLQDATQYLYYAQILQTNMKYSEAAKWYGAFLEKNPGDQRAKNQREACLQINQLRNNNHPDFIIEQLPFNTDGYDFGATLYKNTLIYTSSGGKDPEAKKVNAWTGEPFMDLYAVVMDEKGNIIEDKKKWGVGVNSKYNDGPMCVSPDGSLIYFTRNNYNPDEKKGKKLTYSDDREAHLKIYQANAKSDSMWAEVKQLSFNSKNYSCGHPSISADGNTLYFTSDMPGSIGGADIWKVQKSGDAWGTPVNLGTEVNTEGDEMFPFVSENGTLYFASDGQPGFGGLDVFSYSGSGKPQNMGTPFNSSYDDFAYLVSASGYYGFLSSDRPGGNGEDDIYRFVNNKYMLEILVVDKETQQPVKDAQVDVSQHAKLFQQLMTPVNGTVTAKVDGDSTYHILADAHQYMPDSTIKHIEKDETQRTQKVKLQLTPLSMNILVIDAETKDPVENAMITAESGCLQEPKVLSSDKNGRTAMKVLNDCDYNLIANAKGYLPNSRIVQVRNLNGVLEEIIELRRVDDKPVVLNNIYYDFDKWNIRPDAEPDLELLLQFLNMNPDANIELSSHTDARGDDAYNQQLSQKRAESAVKWLIQHGIKANRMKAVGYGEKQPVNFCVNNVQCDEEEHQKNRRTEFKVLNAGQVTKSLPKKDIKVDPCPNCPF